MDRWEEGKKGSEGMRERRWIIVERAIDSHTEKNSQTKNIKNWISYWSIQTPSEFGKELRVCRRRRFSLSPKNELQSYSLWCQRISFLSCPLSPNALGSYICVQRITFLPFHLLFQGKHSISTLLAFSRGAFTHTYCISYLNPYTVCIYIYRLYLTLYINEQKFLHPLWLSFVLYFFYDLSRIPSCVPHDHTLGLRVIYYTIPLFACCRVGIDELPRSKMLPQLQPWQQS